MHPAKKGNSYTLNLKIEDLRIDSQVNQMGSAVQHHVGEKLRLVNLTSIRTGDSDPDGHFVFDQVWQIVIRTVAGSALHIEIPAGVCPQNTVIIKENIYRMPF